MRHNFSKLSRNAVKKCTGTFAWRPGGEALDESMYKQRVSHTANAHPHALIMNDDALVIPPKSDIPHHDPHRPLVPPPLRLLQAIEGFVRITHEDFAKCIGDGRSDGCSFISGECFIQISALR